MYACTYIYIYRERERDIDIHTIYIYIYIYIYIIVAIFYPFSQFCEINISLLILQTQPNTAPNLFQRAVEYGKYVVIIIRWATALRVFRATWAEKTCKNVDPNAQSYNY